MLDPRFPHTFLPPPFSLLAVNRLGEVLQSYFRSGWAFLIPYLAAYLLYAWLKWPVNAVLVGNMEQGAKSWIPCLLHVYWFLHGVHLVLGTLALRAWWRSKSGGLSANELEKDTGHETSDFGLQSPVSRAAYAALPWLCLALLFWIPGVYLEFPADPWEHYARINWWSTAGSVTDHATWNKSSYFLSYSFLGQLSGSQQECWLNVFYTACCLLLCWQYYRLARVAGLGERASIIFVLLQALLMGNSIFSFYRYYGIASTLFSQLGAISMIRLGLETAKRLKSAGPIRQVARFLLLPVLLSLPIATLIGFNHIQGVGIAALGLLAIIFWSIIDFKRSHIWGLVGILILVSLLAYRFWPLGTELESFAVSNGWLNSWYGFNLLANQSIASERTLHVLGMIGVLNFFAGLWLLRHNHVVGWLTITPIVALCLPFISIPLANALVAQSGITNLVTFHRMFLAIPVGLALVISVTQYLEKMEGSIACGHAFSPGWIFGIMPMILATAMAMPANGPYYNRTWNSLAIVPADLRLSHNLVRLEDIKRDSGADEPRALLTTWSTAYLANATGQWDKDDLFNYPTRYPYYSRTQHASLVQDIIIAADRKMPMDLLVSQQTNLYSPMSQAAYLSGHWLPQYIAIDQSGAPEYRMSARMAGWVKIRFLPEVYRTMLAPRR